MSKYHVQEMAADYSTIQMFGSYEVHATLAAALVSRAARIISDSTFTDEKISRKEHCGKMTCK